MKKIFVTIFTILISLSIFAQGNEKLLTKEKVDELCTIAGKTRETIEEFIVPTEYTAIGYSAFEGCRQLKEIKLHSNITSIDNTAFAKTSLKDLILPENIKSIGKYVFGRSSLQTLTILSKTPPKIPETSDAFYIGFSTNIIIFVPDEAIEKYKNAWKGQSYIQLKPISSK